MTLGKKLGICLGASFALSFSLGFSALIYVSKLRAEVERSINRSSQKAALVNEIRNNILGFRFGERGILLFSQINGADRVEASKQAFAKSTGIVAGKVTELRPFLETERGVQLADLIAAAVGEYVQIQRQVPILCAAGKFTDALQIDMKQLVPIGARATSAAEELAAIQDGLNQSALKRAESLFVTAGVVLGLLVILCLAAASAAAIVTFRSTRKLQIVASRIFTSSEQVHAAADQVSSASRQLAEGAAEQAATLEETSSSAQEIEAMARKNTEVAGDAEQLMSQAEQVGGNARSALTGMEETVERIDNSTSQISRVIRVIDEIAFQTNILALNAAVEAARAGEAGMGFAVVADEVRSLAHRSAQAAKETGGMIEESVASAHEGKKRIEALKQTFSERTRIQAAVKQHSHEIAAASKEQARGMEQITQSVQDMGKAAEKTAAQAEEGAAASTQMTHAAGDLRNIAGELDSLVGHR